MSIYACGILERAVKSHYSVINHRILVLKFPVFFPIVVNEKSSLHLISAFVCDLFAVDHM